MLKNVDARERLVMLDERGREVSSEQLAELIAAAGDRGDTGLVFAIGGPFGHGDAVRTPTPPLYLPLSLTVRTRCTLVRDGAAVKRMTHTHTHTHTHPQRGKWPENKHSLTWL